MHQFVASIEQTDEMETFAHYDVGGVQIGSHFETNVKSETCNDAIVCAEIAENANQILGTTMEEVEYEDNQCNLLESTTSFE